jgi:hypothetical protein
VQESEEGVFVSEKLCVFCKHFKYEAIADYSFSTMTGGTDGGSFCLKNHYAYQRPDDEDEFRRLLLRAEKCKDYERPPK